MLFIKSNVIFLAMMAMAISYMAQNIAAKQVDKSAGFLEAEVGGTAELNIKTLGTKNVTIVDQPLQIVE